MAGAAGLAMLLTGTAMALDLRTINLDLPVGNKTYEITAQAPAQWQSNSEVQLTLDQKFDIQPDGRHAIIQVKLGPAPAGLGAANQRVNPCSVLQGLANALEKRGVRVSAGRQPQANLAPVCSMVTEDSLKTGFYYASIFKSGDIVVAGMASSTSDLDDSQITEFQRYLASIKATPKETTQ